MTKISTSTLDACVDRFEEALQSDERASVAEFFPPRESEHYRATALELLRVDLEHGWRRGRPWQLADYQRKFPEVLSDSTSLRVLAFEEYRLRRSAGEPILPSEYSDRFDVDTSTWPVPENSGNSGNGGSGSGERRTGSAEAPAPRPRDLDRADDTNRFVHSDTAHVAPGVDATVVAEPQVGDRVLDFELLELLGTGRFGRVFLARQLNLAGRPVVLKFSREMWEESDLLAQLQHPHIVPVYSVHRAGPWQVVCMPYCGRRTLATVIDSLGGSLAIANSRDVSLAGLDDTGTAATSPSLGSGHFSTTQPAEQQPSDEDRAADHRTKSERTLDHETWCISFMAKLASGLAHAHQRGIVHRDLKPANVLITDQGDPMLLDFNLSSQVLVGGTGGGAVGGTLPYLSPEHLRAILSGARVHETADVYSAGVLFYELLLGRLPFPHRRQHVLFEEQIRRMSADRNDPEPALQLLAPRVTPSTLAIVRKCLSPDPNARYGNAGEMAEDLRRQSVSLPLIYADDTSLSDRLSKWRRRHPVLTAWAAASVLLVAATSVWTGIAYRQNQHYAQSAAQQVYDDLSTQLQSLRIPLTVPTTDLVALQQAIGAGRAAMEDRRDRQPLGWRHQPAVHWWSARQQSAIARDLDELSFLVNAAQIKLNRLSPNKPTGAEFVGMSTATTATATTATAIRSTSEATAEDGASAGSRPSGSGSETADPRDELSRAVREVAAGEYQTAAVRLQKLTDRLPQDFAVWLLLGNCHYQLRNYATAQQSFSACIALAPTSHVGYFHRGLCRLEEQDWRGAAEDFDRVLLREPQSTAALVNRGLARKAAGQHQEALIDLTRAIELGRRDARTLLIRSRIYTELGDAGSAEVDQQQALKADGWDEAGWIARGLAWAPRDAQQARRDLEMALAWNPQSRLARKHLVRLLAERLNQPSEAEQILSDMIARDAADAEAWISRGVLRARLGRGDEGRQDAAEAMKLSAAPITVYQAACVWALSGNGDPQASERAVEYLTTALRAAPQLAQQAASDPDLQSIRELPNFTRLSEEVSSR